MVGMEGSAVLAVRKVVVVARAAEREVAEGAGAGSARVACVDVVEVRAVAVRDMAVRAVAVRVMAVRAVAVSSAGALQPPREAHQDGSGLVWASFPIPGVNVNTTDATSLTAGCWL